MHRQDSRGCSVYEHTAARFFFLPTDNLHLLESAGLLRDLVTADEDWRRLNLLIDSRRTSHETETQIWNRLKQRPHPTQVVHCLQTVRCWLHLMRQRWQNSWILSSRLMTIPWARNATYENSWKLRIRTALTFWCRHRRLYFKLSQTQNYQRMHISFEYAMMP